VFASGVRQDSLPADRKIATTVHALLPHPPTRLVSDMRVKVVWLLIRRAFSWELRKMIGRMSLNLMCLSSKSYDGFSA
jgi:hypothetical protein